MNFAGELSNLAKTQSARFTLKVEAGRVRASFKRRGHKAEIVSSSTQSADPVLRALLERLGWEGLPTQQLVVEKAKPAQLERLRELVGELRLLRHEILHPVSPSKCEPRLASPRSSLDPRFLQGGSDERGTITHARRGDG